MANPLPAIGRFFKKVGKGIGKLAKLAYGYAENLGLDDDIIGLALKYVKLAEASYVDNVEKREFVVGLLKKAFPQLPESVLRYAVETAFQLLKHELDNHIPQ